MTPRRTRKSRRPSGFFLVVLLTIFISHDLAFATQLQRVRTIRTTPFANTNVSMKDSEGSAYVPRDKSLWLADDYGRAVYEVNPATGALKRVIGSRRFELARRLGGDAKAGTDRTRDFESIAYDRAEDALYVFSGPCCGSSVMPSVFRLKRTRGKFHVASYQPLPRTANFTAAAWNPANGKIYVGHGSDLRTYNYPKNNIGRPFRVPDLAGITGMGFAPDGADLFVTTGAERLRRVRWATKSVAAGWTLDLTPFGIRDSRAVELIGPRFYVLDGYPRPNADPLKYAVFVLSVS